MNDILIMFPSLGAYFVATLITSFLGGYLVSPLLRRINAVDIPNDRSSHSRPVLRGGGVAIVGAITLAAVALQVEERSFVLDAILTGALCIAAVSFTDDLRSLSAGLRFGCQSIVAIAVLWSIFRGASATPLAAFYYCCGFLAITGYTNAFNFMDGINGIAAGQAFVTASGTCLCYHLAGGAWDDFSSAFSVIIAGAAAGFVPHNFPRARLFMGDVGSATLGMLLSSTCVWMVTRIGPSLVPWLLALHMNFILDTGFTLARRVMRGEKWYSAHREHFYQRMVRANFSHACVTGWEMGLQVLVLAMCVSGIVHGVPGILVLVAVLIVWILFFSFAEYQFKRAAA